MKIFDITTGFAREVTDPELMKQVFDEAADGCLLMPNDDFILEIEGYGPMEFEPVAVGFNDHRYAFDCWDEVRSKAAALRASGKERKHKSTTEWISKAPVDKFPKYHPNFTL